MRKQLITLAAGAVLLFSGCAKDGDTGPAGPAGATGSNGNANVKSYKFTVTPGQWQTYSPQDKYVDLLIPDISAEIVNNGMVLIYIIDGTTNFQLPTVAYNGAIPINLLSSYDIGKATVDLYTNNTATINTPTINYEFKVVVASGNRFANPQELDKYVKEKGL